MNLGNFYFYYKKTLEIKYIQIQFNLDKVSQDTKLLNKLLKKDWKIEERYQTEVGVVLELSRVSK